MSLIVPAAFSFSLALFFLLSAPGRRLALSIEKKRANALVYVVERLCFLTLPQKRKTHSYEQKWEGLLRAAGYPLGLDSSEWSLILVLFTGVGAWLLADYGISPWLSLLLPSAYFLRLRTLGEERRQAMAREVPGYLKWISLCLSAGLDFRGALAQILKHSKGALADELFQLFSAMELGVARQRALRTWASELRVKELDEWVRVVELAESRGACVSDALSQLAERQLEERSCRAEEAAARAAVLLIFPLMLLLAAILILLFAPMLVRGNFF